MARIRYIRERHMGYWERRFYSFWMEYPVLICLVHLNHGAVWSWGVFADFTYLKMTMDYQNHSVLLLIWDLSDLLCPSAFMKLGARMFLHISLQLYLNDFSLYWCVMAFLISCNFDLISSLLDIRIDMPACFPAAISW